MKTILKNKSLFLVLSCFIFEATQASQDLNQEYEFYRDMLLKGAKPSARQVCLAAEHGNFKAITLFIENGVCVDQPVDDCTWTPLLHAAYQRHHHVVELLLNAGAQINFTGRIPFSCTALSLAASRFKYNQRVIELLLIRGADSPQYLSDKSREGIEYARENIERRKLLTHMAATLRRHQKNLPTGVQQIIADFLRPEAYDENTIKLKIQRETKTDL
jgi:hypothetical protein